MADGKWIDGLTPDLPAEEAAALVLSVRLAAVTHHLPLAVEQSDDDPEYVHQLRVATRRTGAALRIFRPLLPKKVHRQAKLVLRSLRRAAGEARDWDVFLELHAASEAMKTPTTQAAADFLTGYALGQRSPAQAHLNTVAAALDERLAAVAHDLPKSLRPPDPPQSLAALGSALLPQLLHEFTAGLESESTDPHALHQLRIAGKRLRYAMEVFATCYTPPFRDVLYPAVEQAQTILGAVQDGHVARERLEALQVRLRKKHPATAKRVRAGFAGLLAEVRKRVTVEKRAFRIWERKWRKLMQTHPLASLRLPD